MTCPKIALQKKRKVMETRKKRVRYTKLFRDTVIKSYFRSEKSVVVETRRMWKNCYKRRDDLVNSQNITTFESINSPQVATP